MELKDRNKQFGFVRFINSFKYTFQGLKYAVRNEQSVIIMIICLTIVLVCGFLFHITKIEWFFVLISIGLVLGSELLNTAIEATLDLLSPAYHPLAKIAKDTASASVFVYSCVAFIIGCVVFIPNIIKMFQ